MSKHEHFAAMSSSRSPPAAAGAAAAAGTSIFFFYEYSYSTPMSISFFSYVFNVYKQCF